ncbi:MAG: hypothetical protein AMS20_05950 [Gemmatimonas sp. SG8_28]|nr:MAG: hypothetical protein AMS20_05950 [Gemmatimonas sp. SG8_28]
MLGAYALLVAAWARLIAGWSQRLPYHAAFRIWALSNLGRYLPGKIWSVAGLAVLAQREGVSPWAATGSAIVMQAMALGTGTAIALATLPAGGSTLALVAAVLLAVGGVLAVTDRRVVGRLARLAGRTDAIQPLSLRAAFVAGGANLAAWIAYGMAFWLLAAGLLEAHTLTPLASIGIFAAGYLVGLVSLFAPGGVGVREAMYLALITPLAGGGAALTLTVGSRLLLTATEIVAALAALALTGRKETTVDQS